MLRLEIGGGPSPAHPEFTQFDAIDWSERTGLTYTLGDMRELPYPDKSVNEIYASNVLEHVSFLETRRTLTEWNRVLADHSLLTVVVPDLLGIFQDYLDGINPWSEFVERVYGAQTYELDLHRAGFNLSSLPDELVKAGFSMIGSRHTHKGGGVTAMATPDR